MVWRCLWEKSSQYSIHLRSCLLPRQSASSPLDNRVPPMANFNQATDLKGIHYEMHDIAEQIKVMNELDEHLVQHLTQPPPQYRSRKAQIDLTILINRAIRIFLEITKTPAKHVSHEVIVVDLPASIPRMESEVGVLRSLDHNPLVVKKLASEEDCLARIAVLSDTTVMHQLNKNSRIWMPE